MAKAATKKIEMKFIIRDDNGDIQMTWEAKNIEAALKRAIDLIEIDGSYRNQIKQIEDDATGEKIKV